VWVHGSADGLGDGEAPAIDLLAGRRVTWLRLTHRDAGDPQALATYEVDRPLPADLGSRSHFFWTSGSLLRRALETCTAIRAGWHASGPGRTAHVMRDMLGASARTSVWLDYEQWHRHVTS
jgi:hydroxymethylbilane synthase